jgi:hypothetical protein
MPHIVQHPRPNDVSKAAIVIKRSEMTPNARRMIDVASMIVTL